MNIHDSKGVQIQPMDSVEIKITSKNGVLRRFILWFQLVRLSPKIP